MPAASSTYHGRRNQKTKKNQVKAVTEQDLANAVLERFSRFTEPKRQLIPFVSIAAKASAQHTDIFSKVGQQPSTSNAENSQNLSQHVQAVITDHDSYPPDPSKVNCLPRFGNKDNNEQNKEESEEGMAMAMLQRNSAKPLFHKRVLPAVIE